MAKLETVKVAFGDGFLIINQSDFDPKQHTHLDGDSATGAGKDSPSELDTVPDALVAERRLELETEPWQTLKQLASELDPPVTEKPDGGWDEVIPLILEKEFG